MTLLRKHFEKLGFKAKYIRYMWKGGRMIFQKSVKYEGKRHTCYLIYMSSENHATLSVGAKEHIPHYHFELNGIETNIWLGGAVFTGRIDNITELETILIQTYLT